jgi:hypothetical protein
MALLGIALAGPAFCTVEYSRYELYQLVCRADLVVTGTIRSVDREKPHWWQRLFGNSEETREFQLDVEETVAGTPVTGSLPVHCFKNWTCACRWAPYEKGQRVLLFLSRSETGDNGWFILGGGGEGEMPLLRDSVCVRGFAVHGYPNLVHAIGKESAEGSLVPLDQFKRAVQGFRETYVWALDDMRCFLTWIRPKESFTKAKEFAATSLTARHLHDEAVTSRVWTGDPLELGIREFPASLPMIDAEVEALSAKSPLGSNPESDVFLRALRIGLDVRCAFVGDIDGDGAFDLAIGVHTAYLSTRRQGAAWILFLNPDGSAKRITRIPERQDDSPPSMDESTNFGQGLAGVGDLDGNGVPDLAVGAPGFGGGIRDSGSVWITLLAKDGSVTNAVEIGRDPKLQAAGVEPGCGFGASIANLGDLDGDGFPELAIGEYPEFEKAENDGRAVFIVSLGRDGIVRWVRRLHDRQDGFTTRYSCFGEMLAGPGDLDGDGIPDLAISEANDSDGGANRGAVWLVFLTADGSMKGAKKISNWEGGFSGILHNSSRFGASLCAPGDIDGDGVPDLLVGSSEGLWTLFLKRDGSVRTHTLVSNPSVGGMWVPYFPISIASTRTREGARTIRLAFGEMVVTEQGQRSETLGRAILDATGALQKQ